MFDVCVCKSATPPRPARIRRFRGIYGPRADSADKQTALRLLACWVHSPAVDPRVRKLIVFVEMMTDFFF